MLTYSWLHQWVQKHTHHDRHQRADHWQRGGLSQNQLRQDHTEDRLQSLHSVGETDGHSCEGQVGSHMADGVHGGGPRNRLELRLGDGLQEEEGATCGRTYR